MSQRSSVFGILMGGGDITENQRQFVRMHPNGAPPDVRQFASGTGMVGVIVREKIAAGGESSPNRSSAAL